MIKLILKGVLLYSTVFSILLFIAGIDSICDNGYFTISACICAILCYLCYKTISSKDFKILTFDKYLDIDINESDKKVTS